MNLRNIYKWIHTYSCANINICTGKRCLFLTIYVRILFRESNEYIRSSLFLGVQRITIS